MTEPIWNTVLLDALLDELQQEVRSGIQEAQGLKASQEPESEEKTGEQAACVYEVLGYWMYRLQECRESRERAA